MKKQVTSKKQFSEIVGVTTDPSSASKGKFPEV